MNSLVYIVENSDTGFAVAKTRVQNIRTFKGFSDLVSNDKRVPPREKTVVGGNVTETYDPDYEGAKIWSPVKPHKNSLGCALVPRIIISDGSFVKDNYAYAFQGFDKERETCITGLFGYWNTTSDSMSLISSGLKRTKEQLEETIERFFEKTGLRPIEFEGPEVMGFSKIYKEIIKELDRQEYVKNGFYIYAALLQLNLKSRKPL